MLKLNHNLVYSFKLLTVFIHGIFITALFFLVISSNYETHIYKQILEATDIKSLSDEDKILKIQESTYNLLEPNRLFFNGKKIVGLKSKYFRSADLQLINGGSCGTFTHVLGRLLQEENFTVRIAQMKCGDHWGCHILLEVKVDGRFVVLDPLYNLSFRNNDGNLASFNDVKNNFAYYSGQLPENYGDFKFEDVRYTNWNKIPLVMPLIKVGLDYFYGSEADYISVRSYALNAYKIYFNILLTLWILFIISTFLIAQRLKSQSSLKIKSLT